MGRELINPVMTISVKNNKPRFDNPELFKQFCSEQSDGRYVISIEPIDPKRSIQWNKYYWKVVIRKGVCRITGYSESEAHETMLYFFSRVPDPDIPGEFTIKRTRDMGRKEFIEYIEKVNVFILDFFGVRIPEPSEITY